MATSYKNIVITPNISNTSDPKIVFSGANTTVNTDITLNVYPDSNGALSFDGSAGQLFSITNDLSNSLFSVSDVSGIPSIEVFANGLVSLIPTSGNVVFGAANAGIIANTTGVYVSSNSTVNTTQTAALMQVANSTSTANLTALDLKIGTTTVNSTQITATTVAANLSGSYANITGQVNTATLYATTSANIASAVQANATGLWTTGTVNAATHSVGAAFTANSTVVNAVSYYSGTLLVANNTVINATHLSGNTASDLRTYSDQKADNAYSNAVSYVDGKSYVNTSQLSSNLSNYAQLSSATFTGNVTANNANTIFDLTVGRNLTVTGNLTIIGSSTVLQGNAITFSDNMLYLNQGILATITGASGNGTYVDFTANNNFQVGWDVFVSGVTPSSYNGNYQNIFAANSTHFTIANTNTDTYTSGGTARGKSDQNPDLGFAAGYNDGTYHHTGIFRDASDGYWKVFDGYAPEPDAAVNIDTSNLTFSIANFWANSINFGNTSVYSTANSTTFSGTSNNTSFVGTVSAANVVSNAQLSANLGNYQTTAGLSTNVAALTANNTSFVGAVSAANVVSNAQLSANLGNYQTTAGLSANVATLTSNNSTYFGGYTWAAPAVLGGSTANGASLTYANVSGQVNTATLYAATSANVASIVQANSLGVHVGANVVANTTALRVGNTTITTTNAVFGGTIGANGGIGTAGQVLTSGAAGNVYWSTVTGGSGSTNVDATYAWTNTHTFAANVSFTGNVGIGAAAQSYAKIYVESTAAADASRYNQYSYYGDSNGTMTAARTKLGFDSQISNFNQNKSGDGLTTYDAYYYAIYGEAYSGSSSSSQNAYAYEMTGGRFVMYHYANGAGSNTVNNARGIYGQVYLGGTNAGLVNNAYGSISQIFVPSATSTGIVNNAYGVFSGILSNTGYTINNGYLFYGSHQGSTTTNKVGLYIVGEANNYISGNTYFQSNVGLGTTGGRNDTRLNMYTNTDVDFSSYGIYNYNSNPNTALTAAPTRYGIQTSIRNLSQNKDVTGVTNYSTNFRAVVGDITNGDSSTRGDARANEMISGNFRVYNYANGATSNTISTAKAAQHQVFSYGTGVISTAYGSLNYVGIGNTTATGNITTAYGTYSEVQSNTAGTIATGYLYYGQHTGATTTTKYGLFVTGEANNYMSGNLVVGGSINAAAYAVGSSFVANTTQVTIATLPLSANGDVGTDGQVLTSNGSATYWATNYGLLDVTSAAGTTTLTSTSPKYVRVTGTLTQTIVLPAVGTLPIGTAFFIHNLSTGQLTVQSSGLNTIVSPVQNHAYEFRSVATTGTNASVWQYHAAGTTAVTGTGNMIGGFRPTIAQLQMTSSTSFTAGTDAQGQGALSENVTVITTTASNPSGVTLPSAGGFGTTASRVLVVINKGTNPVNVYPVSGGQIDALGTNVALSLPVGGMITFYNASTTQWYSTTNSVESLSYVKDTLAITNGGTGANDTATARTNLGLKTGATTAITVSNTAPTSPGVGDIWFVTN